MAEVVSLGAFDAVVIEPTLVGCAAAWRLAQGGFRVALVAAGTSPGSEYAGNLQPWLAADAPELPAPFATIFEESLTGRGPEDASELHLGRWTQAVEDLLLDAGVTLFYHATIAAGLLAEGRTAGVLLGGKFGLNALLAPVVVDASPLATAARCLGARFERRPAPDAVEAEYSLLLQQTRDAEADPSPIELDTPGGALRCHGRFVTLRTRVEFDPLAPMAESLLALAVRDRALAALGDPAWAALERDVLFGGETPRLSPVLRARDLPANVIVLGPCADVADDEAALINDPARPAVGLAQGLGAAEALLEASRPRQPEGALVATLPGGLSGPTVPGEAGRFGDAGYQPPGSQSVRVRLPEVPVVDSADLLVAGLGTSGYTAGCHAAQLGLSVLAIEKHADLGGTHTVGGVPNYWFGRRTDYFKQYENDRRRRVRDRRLPLTLALYERARESGLAMRLRTTHVGVASAGRKLEHVFVTAGGGLVAIRAGQAIDASGDGDLAAWAGAAYRYGRETDEMTMWCSFGKFQDHRHAASRLYHDVADQRSAADTARAIVAGRRQTGIFGAAEFPQPYLAVRESRHIVGRSRLRYADVLSERRLPGAVLTLRSNMDIKGMAGGELALCGFVEPEFGRNFTCDLPLGCLQPRDLDNVLVIGKAYDAEHDALTHARMQSDLMAMGGLAALVAQAARDGGVDVNNVQPQPLIAPLREVGILDADAQLSGDQQRRRAADRLKDCSLDEVARAIGRGELGVSEQVWLIEQREAAIEPLRRALAHAEAEPKRTLARCLVFLGERGEPAEVLLDDLDAALAEPQLSRGIESHHAAPDHGYQPEAAAIINALGRLGDQRVIPRMAKLAGRLELDATRSDYRFHYVYAIAEAAGRLACEQAAAPAAQIARDPAICGRTLTFQDPLQKAADHIALRFAFLELWLGRALHRCGHASGVQILTRYQSDRRACLARTAAQCLAQQPAAANV